MAAAKRQALFVLGMHRSGTSAFGGVLARLGVHPPKTLMTPTKDNPQGYWESLELLNLHERILSSAGSRWNDWGPFNPAWIDSTATQEFEELIPELLHKEFGAANLILIKDPRACRFFPLWQRALRKHGYTPKVVIPIRHPLEVARSLEVRDHFGRNRSLLLWLRHVLDAEASTRRITRTFVSYEHLLNDWKGQATKMSKALNLKWPKWSADTEADITDFLSSQHRHHVVSSQPVSGEGELSSWVAQAYGILRQLADDDQLPDPRSDLDRIKREFDRTSEIYAAVVREHEIRGESLYVEKKTQLAETSRQLDERNKKYEELAKSYAAGQQAMTDYQSRISSLKEQVEERTRQLSERNRKYEELAKSYAAGQQAMTDYQSRISSLKEQVEERTRQLSERNRKYEELARSYQSGLQLASERKKQHSEEVSALRDRSSKAESALEERFKEIAKLTSIVFELEESIASKDKALAEADGIRSNLLEQHQRQLQLHDRALASMHDMEKQHERRIVLFEHVLAARNAHNDLLEQLVETHRQRIRQQQLQLEDIEASALWRVTKPLRSTAIAAQDDPLPLPDDGLDREAALLQESDLFDPEWYLARYPEVAGSAMEPVYHYLRSGAAAGYNPGPEFDTVDYLIRYPDVRHSGKNPLVHFIEFGLEEGRSASAVNND